MLTQNEITSLSLSPTKKDFVQIWNELLEVAGKLSERWDPTSTNESDPGIVILKALTGIADKLNYNIDKNILEAFMPTAAQEDSMRKLCDMLGYSMKYYRSATTKVAIRYYNPEPSDDEKKQMSSGLFIPKFTVITNGDQDVRYFTTNQRDLSISEQSPFLEIPCMEGQVVKCESINNNSVITVNQISENNRFYLPETQIAENGFFIYNVRTGTNDVLEDGIQWNQVTNLNVQPRGTRAFKFGFDSYESRPYIEFPEDYSELFNEGIFVYYTRTNGVNGNVSPRTLTQLELPTGDGWGNVSVESFNVENIVSATTGANAETIKQAYTNFKKTIGTFETLVTCRDYMNKVYSMVNEDSNKPYVSNILVTDIRNDINRAVTICSCDGAGIYYKETPLINSAGLKNTTTKPVYNPNRLANNLDTKWFLGSVDGLMPLYGATFIQENANDFDYTAPGDSSAGINNDGVFPLNGFWAIKQNNVNYVTTLPVETEQAIDHFDLIFYPFKAYSQLNGTVKEKDIKNIYNSSFKFTTQNLNKIKQELDAANIRTIAHNIKCPRSTAEKSGTNENFGDLVSINNYLRLNATVATNTKVTEEERKNIIKNIKISLANAFNMRELDFGENIPFESIISTIEKADPRIRVASINEPALYTTFSVVDNYTDDIPNIIEYAVASEYLAREDLSVNSSIQFNTTEARKIYNKLAVRNILAGRLPLFNYNTTFKSSFSEAAYQITEVVDVHDVPDSLIKPKEDMPYTVALSDNNIFAGRWIPDNADGHAVYTKTYTPDDYSKNTIDSDAENAAITSISTNCEITGDAAGVVTNVTLGQGERITFRAPNFITTKTYPAYVNYNLVLEEQSSSASPQPAEAVSLFSLLNDTPNGWANMFDFFNTQADAAGNKCVEEFTIKQKISSSSAPSETPSSNTVEIVVNSSSSDIDVNKQFRAILAKSGCVKLVSHVPTIEWEDEAPAGETLPELPEFSFSSDYLVNADGVSTICEQIDSQISKLSKEELPKTGDWIVSFKFAYAPFETRTLENWDNFASTLTEDTFGITPVANERQSYLWRLFGEGYDIGERVTVDGQKLLPFASNYFGLLPEQYLTGIYVVKNLGFNAKYKTIKNGDEYQLGEREFLYIEYTPSTTTEDGTTKELAAKTEVYGKGTIIRPGGFEDGLIDSLGYGASHTPVKENVSFNYNGTSILRPMYSLGANEQIEIRDTAEVILSNDTFESGKVYVYKNFNNCPELEKITEAGMVGDKKVRINNEYTLKDGEYIFYTDKNKADFAYFTSGTKVVLEGEVVLPQFEVIDISAIYDDGLNALKDLWRQIPLDGKNSIIFKEYQYITLDSGDTLKSLAMSNTSLSDDGHTSLSGDWQACTDVEYIRATDAENTIRLPTITVDNSDWEVRSTLELAVTPEYAQVLRKTDKISTSLVLHWSNDNIITVNPRSNEDETTSYPLSFKLNLACYSNAGQAQLGDVDDTGADTTNANGFKLKLFAADAPVIVQTACNKIVPSDIMVDLANWRGTALEDSSYLESWQKTALENIQVGDSYDCALRLPVELIPNTYGIFCIYLDYTDKTVNNNTWIELLTEEDCPVTDYISLVNTKSNKIAIADHANGIPAKLFLNPGINCIRVNKTGKIFIKASKDTKGTLYFDELKLVDVEMLDCIGGTTRQTQGLNLSQIGYLATTENTGGTVASTLLEEVKQAAIASAVANAEIELDAVYNNVEAAIYSEYKELATTLPKVKAIVHAEDTINKTVDSLDNKLVDKYRYVRKNLEAESALLDALQSNKDIDSLSAQLVSLQKGLEASIPEQKSILNELALIESDAITNINEIGNDCILEDLECHKNIVELSAVKTRAIELANEAYETELASIKDKVANTINSEAAGGLLELLASLQANQDKETNAILASLLAQLTETADQTALDVLLDSIDQSAAAANYTQLLVYLNQLLAKLEPTDLQRLVDELSTAIDSNNSELLGDTLDAIYDIVENDSVDPTLSGIKANINSLIEEVSAKIDEQTTEVDQAILSTVASLRSDIATLCQGRLIAIIDDISDIVETKTNLDKAIEKLTVSGDGSMDAIIANLLSATDTNNEVIKTIMSVLTVEDTENAVVKEYFDKAYVDIWPEYIAKELSNCIASIAEILSDAKEATREVFYEKIAELKAYKTLSNAVDVTSISALFDHALASAKSKEQAEVDVDLIKEIGTLVPIASELVDQNGRIDNLVIIDLLTNLSAADTSEKRLRVLQELEQELTASKLKNEQLVNILEGLMWPDIIKLELSKDLRDSFFDLLHEQFAAVKDSVFNGTEYAAINDIYYANLLDQPFDTFKTAIENFECPDSDNDGTPNKSLLPMELIQKIIDTSIMAVNLKSDKDTISAISNLANIGDVDITVINADIKEVLDKLKNSLDDIGELDKIPEEYAEPYNILLCEEQLLNDILLIDSGRDFYYNVSVEPSRAIELNKKDKKLNSLMCPLTNYDINNINNNFVISKLDIDYLTDGIKIARSSTIK